MRRYTTPNIEIVVEGIDLTASHVYVTLWQHGAEVTTQVGDDDMSYDGSNTTINVAYTQEQTSVFCEGRAKIQVNWIDTNERRNATDISSIRITGNLLGRTIEDG